MRVFNVGGIVDRDWPGLGNSPGNPSDGLSHHSCLNKRNNLPTGGRGCIRM